MLQIEKQFIELLTKLEKKELMSCPLCKSTGIQTDNTNINHFCHACKGWGLLEIPEPSFDTSKLPIKHNFN